MADTQDKVFDFELVSPERKLISEPVGMVVVPGEEGDFGVLPNHSALVSSIRPGVLRVYRPGEEQPSLRIFIAGGFADVSPTNLTVLAEEAVKVEDLNADDLQQTIRNLSADLGIADNATEKTRIEKRLALAQAKLAAVTGQAAA